MQREAEGDGEAVLARQEEAECGSPGCRGAWVEAMVSQRPRKKRAAKSRLFSDEAEVRHDGA